MNLTFRFKLTLGYALIFGLSVIIGATLVYFTARYTLTQTLDRTLEETAQVARASLEDNAKNRRFPEELRRSSDLSIELFDSSGKRLDAVGNLDPKEKLTLALGFESTPTRRVLTLTIPEDKGLLLRVSRPKGVLSRLLETLAKILIIGALVMIFLSSAVGYLLADRALKPLDAVVRTARRITQRGTYQERVPAQAGQDEMARLTLTVNEMLDRLEQTIEREKRFARNAAHELRTPLTALKGWLELTLDKPRDAAGYKHGLEKMQNRVQALHQLMNQLENLSHTDRPIALERVELGGVALECSENLDLEPSGKTLEVTIEDYREHWVWAEDAGVRQVMHNLLENAFKYSTGDQIWLEVGQHSFQVRDNGTGPARAEWARLLQPFERGMALQSVAGSGLGLPLVVALLARWDAQLRPIWQGGPGFAVQVVWPALEVDSEPKA